MSDLTPSIIRTGVPLIVGPVVTWAASKGVDIDGEALTSAIAAVVGLAYYIAARLLERRWPALGRLLGSKKAPTYLDPPPPPA